MEQEELCNANQKGDFANSDDPDQRMNRLSYLLQMLFLAQGDAVKLRNKLQGFFSTRIV